MQRGRSTVSLGDLLSAGSLQPGQQLTFRQRPEVTAEVLANGRLKFGGTEYSSPSTAARAVLGGTSTNGWLAWSIREGDVLVALSDVRARHLGQ